MGYSISWLAIRGIDTETMHGRLGLVPTGASGDRVNFANCGRSWKNGWTLVVLDGAEHALLRSDSLTQLSANCSLIACTIEEHVMASSAEAWESGRKLWVVSHQGDESVDHLQTEGDLPPAFGEIERHYRAAQARADGVDYVFEIPLVLAKGIAAFKHDETEDAEFSELEAKRAAAPAKRWWRFGR
jgi:hypothetical protein